MEFETYQYFARKTAVFPKEFTVIYPAMGVASEAGECLEKIKKQLRDKNCNWDDVEFKEKVAKEMGDVLWYLANLAEDLGMNLNDVAELNLKKLKDRQDRGVLKGEGDNR